MDDASKERMDVRGKSEEEGRESDQPRYSVSSVSSLSWRLKEMELGRLNLGSSLKNSVDRLPRGVDDAGRTVVGRESEVEC